MGISMAPAPQPRPLEDPLAHLPCSTILEYRKGQTIYSHDQPSTSIYLVIDGKVKVVRLADDGHQVVVDIYQADEFFGESAFLSLPHRSEQATALEDATLEGASVAGTSFLGARGEGASFRGAFWDSSNRVVLATNRRPISMAA